MPDRYSLAKNPQSGDIFLFTRHHSNWVVMVERVTATKVYWIWQKGITTLQQALKLTHWDGDSVMRKQEWSDWLINSEYRADKITLLTLASNQEPAWEV